MEKAKKATVRTRKKSEDVQAGREPRELFIAALDVAKELVGSKALHIAVDIDGDVDVGIDSDVLARMPEDKFAGGVTKEFFLHLLHTELQSLLEAATHDEPVMGLESGIPQSVIDEVGIEEFLWRLREAEKSLLPRGLKEQAALRRTTDAFVIKDLRWQVAVRKHDHATGRVQDIPYACFSIGYDRRQRGVTPFRISGKGMAVEFPVLREPKQLTLELHEADVDQLIGTLTELRNRLEKARKEK